MMQIAADNLSIPAWLDQAVNTSTATDCVVIAKYHNQLNLRWANNSLTSNGLMQSCSATVISFTDNQVGSVSGPLDSLAGLLEMIKAADAASLIAPKSPDAHELIKGEIDPDFNDPAVEVNPHEFGELTQALGRAFAQARQDDHLLFGFAELDRTTYWLASSTGLRRRFMQPAGRFEFTAKSPDMINSSYVGQQSNDFTDVDVATHYKELMRRLEWGKHRIELPAGRYETIMSPSTVIDMVYPMLWEMSLRAAQEGRSPFKSEIPGQTKIGQNLATLPLSIWSDPSDQTFPLPPFVLLESSVPEFASVFDNGAPVAKTDWVKDGVLHNLIAPRSDQSQRNSDDPVLFPTDNLIIDAGSTTELDEMIKSTRYGLLLTTLWYIRTVDPQTLLLTGLTRDGVYLIEDGQVKGLVNNFRWNESPLSILQRVSEASQTEHCLCREWNDWFIRSKAPYLRVPDFNMSTVSKAY